MRSYKLCAAIVAIACIALQEVDCLRSRAEVETNSEENADADAVTMDYQEEDCGEYKSQIWDNAFKNSLTMQLAKVKFDTDFKMSTNPVCSDTIRSLLNFVQVISTDENAHSALGMFLKLIKTIAKQVTQDVSGHVDETKQLILRAIDTPSIRDLISKTINRSAELFKDPANRVRLLTLVKVLIKTFKPSKNANSVKQRVQSFKNIVTSPKQATSGAMKKLKSFLR